MATPKKKKAAPKKAVKKKIVKKVIKKKSKKAAPKKAAPKLLYDGPKDYRGYCDTDDKPINKRWKTYEEAVAERDAHIQDNPDHDVDIEERQ